MLLDASCWVSCDGLASHPGGGGSSNAPSPFMLQIPDLSNALAIEEASGSFSPL